MNLNEIDYTKQTVTLGSKDNPAWTLAVGHKTPEEFNKLVEGEGWDGLDFNEESELIKTKGMITDNGKKWDWSDEIQNHKEAVNITLLQW